MSEIADDVMRAAREAVEEMCDLHSYAGRPAWEAVIAHAILAERERCQKEFAEIIARALLDKVLSDMLNGIDFKKLLGEHQGGLITKNPAI